MRTEFGGWAVEASLASQSASRTGEFVCVHTCAKQKRKINGRPVMATNVIKRFASFSHLYISGSSVCRSCRCHYQDHMVRPVGRVENCLDISGKFPQPSISLINDGKINSLQSGMLIIRGFSKIHVKLLIKKFLLIIPLLLWSRLIINVRLDVPVSHFLRKIPNPNGGR